MNIHFVMTTICIWHSARRYFQRTFDILNHIFQFSYICIKKHACGNLGGCNYISILHNLGKSSNLNQMANLATNNIIGRKKFIKSSKIENYNNHSVGHFSESSPLIRKSIEASSTILITHGHRITPSPPVSPSAIKHFTTLPIKKFQQFNPRSRRSISASVRLDRTAPIETVGRNKGWILRILRH